MKCFPNTDPGEERESRAVSEVKGKRESLQEGRKERRG